MYRLLPLIMILSCVQALAAPRERPLYDDRFFEPVAEVVSPHITWAKPYVTPPKVLFLTHRGAMREAIEVAQRLDMDYKVFAMESPSMFGATGLGVDASWTLIRGNSSEELAERLRKHLAEPHDVIVVGGIDWDKLPLDCRYEILKQVKAGTGLVGCIRQRDQYLPEILKSAEFGWNYGVWSGAAQGIADFFGVGVFESGVDYAGGHTGQASVRIETKSVTKGSRESPRAGYSFNPIELQPNTEYTLSIWTKTQGMAAGGATANIHPFIAGASIAVPVSDDWKLSQSIFKTTDAPPKIGLYLLGNQVGTVWFDDVSLTKAGDQTNLLPNPSFEYPGLPPAELATGFAYQTLPAFASYASEAEFLRRSIGTSTFGQGRIGLVNYAVPTNQMMTPGPDKPVQYCRDDYDYYLQLAIRLILWGAKKSPPVVVTSAQGDSLSGEVGKLTKLDVTVRSTQAVPKVTVSANIGGAEWGRGPIRPIDLKPGDNTLVLDLPSLPGGQHRLNVQVSAAGKTIGFGTLVLTLTSHVTIKSLDLSQDSFSLNEPLKGKIVTAGPTNDAAVQLSARDNNGRLIGQGKVAITGAATDFTLPVITSSTIIGWLDAVLVLDNKPLASARRDFSINNLYAPRDDVQLVMWQSYPNDFLGPLMAESFTRNGVDAFYGGGAGYGPYANQWWLPYATRFTDTKTDWYQEKPTRQPGDLVRDPCLTNPEYRATVQDTLSKAAALGLRYSTSDFTLGDENMLVSGAWDLCFSDTCIRDFRRWALLTYSSLAGLNAEWGTDFQTWSEVKPQTLEEAKQAGNLVPWVDHRLHMETVWAGIHDYSRGIIKETVPHARVGYEGSDSHASTWLADDYWQLARAMDLNNIYYRDFLSLAWRDFATKDMLLGAGWFGGYAGNRNEPFMRWFPWRTLFKGANSFWVWNGWGNAGSVMSFDTSLYPFFQSACEEIAEIKQGSGKLLMHADRMHDGIAILWSNSSMHLAAATPEFPDIDTTLNSTVAILHDCGVETKVLSYAELKQGKLTNRDFKVLLLPTAQALSPAEVEQIKQFVSNGGTVIADLRPAVTDEHGKPYAPPALDEVFGIEQGPQFKRVVGALQTAELKLDAALADESLSLGVGQAAAKIGETPAVITHPFGKGKAILLNFSLQGYAKLPKVAGQEFAGWSEGAGYRAFLGGLLKASAVEPQVRVLPDAPQVEVSRFRDGAAEYVGIVQSLPLDAMQYTNKTASAPQARPITIDFGRKAHLYDVRSGKYLGETQTLRTKLTPGIAQLYALLPYRVDALTVQTAPQGKPGDSVTCDVKLAVRGRPAIHVIRVQVFGPDGKERSWYARNVMTDQSPVATTGLARGTLQLALDDQPGTWKIVARDVATGVTGSATLKVVAK